MISRTILQNVGIITSLLALCGEAFTAVHRRASLPSRQICLSAEGDIGRPTTFLDSDDDEELEGMKITFVDENDTAEKVAKPSNNRWENLNPKLKERLIERGQQKAIANKKKREPAKDKKRRAMMFFKEKEKERKLASRVQRPLGFDERTPLTAFLPGMEVNGVVISLANFGAYIDIGTECDGLLHISQITRDFFVEHPRQVLTPGDEVTVRIKSTSPELKKMHLTMLSVETQAEEEEVDEDDDEEAIPLTDIEPDDELWGILKRVTDFGAYVEVGAEVDGFLHFMDHPSWDGGAHPSDFMKTKDRVRIWVVDIDREKRRLKLTANRPTHIPGPRREMY